MKPANACPKCADDESKGGKLEGGDREALSSAADCIENKPADLNDGDGSNECLCLVLVVDVFFRKSGEADELLFDEVKELGRI